MRKLRMQFCRYNASSTFKRFVDEITCGLEGVYSFSDDILIASKMHGDHIVYHSALFQLLHHYGLTFKSSKCTLGAFSLTFLGFHVSEKGLEHLHDRVESLQNFPRYETIPQLQTNLWVCTKPLTYW
ncbi:transposon Ty3-G Gag-Pol polyprotein [Caerostris darwini]|uniref:Transposon Ty3-G Gag-Pol polyprotein n=1 Tax=Caerostris darwini TaxID=1538125 RepID=A0AAV4VDJ8_9ARAC|nr:transposon Ty3-G Gag-Pol polyprotein [Caerostris darwini]